MSISLKRKAPEIPDEFLCPISGARMRDPVLCTCTRHCGTTFERAAILQWLQTGPNQRCPNTSKELTAECLFPVRALKALIEKWVETHGEPPGAAPPVEQEEEAAAEHVARLLELIRIIQHTEVGEVAPQLLLSPEEENLVLEGHQEARGIPLRASILAGLSPKNKAVLLLRRLVAQFPPLLQHALSNEVFAALSKMLRSSCTMERVQ
eukprot:gene11426-13502_t